MPKRAPISRAVGTNRKEDRIRSHVLLCWLALHLVRVAEPETGETWERLRKD